MKKTLNIFLIIFIWIFLTSCFWKDDDKSTLKENSVQSSESWKTLNNSSSWVNNNSWTKDDWVFSQWKQDIIKLQLKKWPDVVSTLDCSKFDAEWKTYCEKEKAKLEERKKEITWESVLKKWDAYIKTFDCTKIASTYWQKYCSDYKKNIK